MPYDSCFNFFYRNSFDFVETSQNGGGYTRDTTDAIKGVSAILIILHHISWQAANANGIVIWFYREINLFAVGIFLLFSGYGLSKSIQTKHDCNKLLKYTTHILSTYLIVFLIKIVFDIANGRMTYNVFLNLITLQMYPSNLWYIKGQIFCYILFAIGIMAFGKCTKSIVFMMSVISVWIYIGITMGRSVINDAWYDTLMLFPFGVLLAIDEKEFVDITKKHPIAIIGMATLLSGLVVFIQKSLLYVVVSIWSVLIYLVATSYIEITGNIWRTLGKHSLSVFLIHLVLIDYAKNKELNIANGLVIILIVILTVLLSIVIDKIVEAVMNHIDFERLLRKD